MFLATTALVELWDKEDEILVLGPWCLKYDRRSEWQGLKYRVLPNPWATNNAVFEAEAYCGRVINTLIDGLAEYLNALHDVRFDRRYWQILLGPWLLYYVHLLYDRYVTLKCATNSYPKLRTVLLSPGSYRTPVDTVDFWAWEQGETADVFNFQLYSQILVALRMDVTVCKEVSLSTEKSTNNSVTNPPGTVLRLKQSHFLKTTTKRMLLALARATRPNVILSGGIGLTTRQWLHLGRAMAFRGGALPLSPLLRCKSSAIDHVRRMSLRDLPVSDEFTRTLTQSLPDNIPQIFVEGYAAFREASLKLCPAPPKVIVAATAWYTDEALKFLAAELAQRGCRLIGIQHGGGYGTSRVHPPEKHELSITDRWLSFGWRPVHLDGKVRPLSHPKFLPWPPSKRNSSRDVLLVTGSLQRYPCRFESFPVGRFPEIMESRARFIHTLPINVRSALVVRFMSDDYGWSQRQRLIDACGQIRLDERGRTLRQTAARTRLVVVEYYGTAFLEMLAANVPVVLFWDPTCWETRSDAEPYFESLRRAGILWNSPEAAAAKVTAIYQDPWLWWAKDSVQEARQSFVNRYALGTTDWLERWTETLVDEIAVNQARSGSAKP